MSLGLVSAGSHDKVREDMTAVSDANFGGPGGGGREGRATQQEISVEDYDWSWVRPE